MFGLTCFMHEVGHALDYQHMYSIYAYEPPDKIFNLAVEYAPVETMIQFLPQFTLVEAKSSSGSSGTSGDAGTLSPREAKSQYGISISPSYMDFGSCFVGDKVDPVTITITNNGSHTVDLD